MIENSITYKFFISRSGMKIWKFKVFFQKDRLWHLIPWMRKVFLKIDFEGVEPSNPEAAHLFTDDQEGFKTKVDICVKFR